jgi:hypothetical protein
MKKGKLITSEVIVMAITAMVALFVDAPTLCNGETEVVQCFVGLGAILGGVASLGGGIASAIAANAQAKKAQAESAKSERMLNDWYDTNMNTDILDRADTMSMLAMYRDVMDEQARKYQTNAIKGGASEEAKIAYAQSQSKGYADAISRIAAQGQARKDQVADAYMQGMRDIHDSKANAYLQSGQVLSNAISGAFNGLGTAISGADFGGFGKNANTGKIGYIKPSK